MEKEVQKYADIVVVGLNGQVLVSIQIANALT